MRTVVLALCVLAAACGPDRTRGRAGGGGGRGAGGGGGGPGDDGGVNPDLDPGAEGDGEGDGGDGGAPFVPPPPGGACDEPGAVQSCGAPVLGLCDPGWRTCADGVWGACAGLVAPADEECDDLDNDCDGVVDGEDHGCAPFDAGDPDANASQIQALERINALRSHAGLPVVRFDPALNRAAQNHADYNLRNGGAHDEQPGRPGFTGADPSARAAAEGYEGPPWLFEDMAFGVGPTGAVDMWFDSVYHRVPIMRPDALIVGFGNTRSAEVLNVATDGGGRGDLHALTPYDGQEGVPTEFHSDREGPDPVEETDLVGYPISVVTSRSGVRLVEAEVRADGDGPEELYLATSQGPVRGFLDDSAFVMTARPMARGTWYTVRFVYTVGDQTFDRTWRFRTR